MKRTEQVNIMVSEDEKKLFEKVAVMRPSEMGGATTLSEFIRSAAHKLASEILYAKA